MSGKIAPGASAERTVSFLLTLDAVRTQISAITEGQLVRCLWCGTKSYWCSEPVEALVDSHCGKKRTMVHEGQILVWCRGALLNGNVRGQLTNCDKLLANAEQTPGHVHMDTAQWFCTVCRSNDCGIIVGLGAAIGGGGQCHGRSRDYVFEVRKLAKLGKHDYDHDQMTTHACSTTVTMYQASRHTTGQRPNPTTHNVKG